MFKGRLGVKQYWLSILFLFPYVLGVLVGAFVLTYMVIIPFLVGGNIFLGESIPTYALDGLFILFLLSPIVLGSIVFIGLLPISPFFLGLQIRRLHDMNLSGRWLTALVLGPLLLTSVFPLESIVGTGVGFFPAQLAINVFVGLGILVFMSRKGTLGSNTYGDPTVYPSIWAAIRGKKVAGTSPAVSIIPPVQQ